MEELEKIVEAHNAWSFRGRVIRVWTHAEKESFVLSHGKLTQRVVGEDVFIRFEPDAGTKRFVNPVEANMEEMPFVAMVFRQLHKKIYIHG